MVSCIVAGGAGNMKIAPRFEHHEVTRINGSAHIVDILTRFQIHRGSSNTPPQVVQVTAIHAHHLATCNGAGVDQMIDLEVDAFGADQGARSIEVAIACLDIHLWDQGARCATVRQADILFDQPDNVGGELGHLFGRKGHTRAYAVGAGKRHASIHERLVLRIVIGKAFKESSPRELADLFPDQALLIEPVAHSLLHHGRIQGKRLQHVIRA